ncbi:MAG: PTS transporter subunit EIIC [Clostridia bacterium]|nr:PTS transporter subunit EIIC [Clostridia bacterium]
MKEVRWLRKIEKSYLFIILLLPLAAIMLRLSTYETFSWLGVYGTVIYNNLPLFYAMAIAYGLSTSNRGVIVFSTVIFYLIFEATYKTVKSENDLYILGGILSGISVVLIEKYTRRIDFHGAFELLSENRNLPVFSSIFAFILGAAMGRIWPIFSKIITGLGYWIGHSSYLGTFVYGFLNRLLLPLGLHHNLNSYLWYDFGEYNQITGDMNRFMAGDPSAGTYMSGFYIVMMFGLPALMLAFYFKARKANRKALRCLYAMSILISITTGITEPIELLFLFLLPRLYLIHSVFTGLGLVTAEIFNIKIGFDFSAGLIDFLTYYQRQPGSYKILILGVVFFILYYYITYLYLKNKMFIVPGDQIENDVNQRLLASEYVLQLTEALGGKENIQYINTKFTRFEIQIFQAEKINNALLETFEKGQLLRIHAKTFQLVTSNQGRFLIEAFRAMFRERVV